MEPTPKKVAVITAAILAYLAGKSAQLKPLPFGRKPSSAWSLYGLQSRFLEVENFNYLLDRGGGDDGEGQGRR